MLLLLLLLLMLLLLMLLILLSLLLRIMLLLLWYCYCCSCWCIIIAHTVYIAIFLRNLFYPILYDKKLLEQKRSGGSSHSAKNKASLRRRVMSYIDAVDVLNAINTTRCYIGDRRKYFSDSSSQDIFTGSRKNNFFCNYRTVNMRSLSNLANIE